MTWNDHPMRSIIAALSVLLPSVSSAAEPIHTQLCRLVANPVPFAGKRVTFEANVLTDWRHGTVLTDSQCKRGIELTSTDAVPEAENAALGVAVGTPLTGGYDRSARATFTGVFYWKPAPVDQQAQFYNPRQFTAENITDVSVRQRLTGSAR